MDNNKTLRYFLNTILIWGMAFLLQLCHQPSPKEDLRPPGSFYPREPVGNPLQHHADAREYRNKVVARSNHVPEIEDYQITLDTASYIMDIAFSLSDKEQDAVRVSLAMSADGGKTFFPIRSSALDGDNGIMTKEIKRSIKWRYPDSLRYRSVLLKLVADDGYVTSAEELVMQVDSQRMLQTVQDIFAVRNYKANKVGIRRAQHKIREAFGANSLHVFQQSFPFKADTAINVIGKIPGVLADTSVIILSAHMDTYEKSPGADDNATGISGMLEIMRILSYYSFERSILFIGFDMEEHGQLGSYVFVKQGGIEKQETIAGCFNFDMIGYSSDQLNSQRFPEILKAEFPIAFDRVSANGFRGDFMLTLANPPAMKLTSSLTQASHQWASNLNVISLDLTTKQLAYDHFQGSDHVHFWNAGYPAVHIGDGAYTRNPNYHTPDDVVADINVSFMTSVVKTTLAAIADQAVLKHTGILYIDLSKSNHVKFKI